MDRAKILVCDDDPSLQAAFKLILSDFYELVVVNNGNEATQRLESFNPDLLLLDIKMPRIDGLETLQNIRKVAPELKVIVVTGYQSTSAAQEMSKFGILDYIMKPFESNKLLNAVEKALHSSPTATQFQ